MSEERAGTGEAEAGAPAGARAPEQREGYGYGYGYNNYKGYSYSSYYYDTLPNSRLGMRNLALVFAMVQRHLWSLRWRIALILIVAMAAVQTRPGFDKTSYTTNAELLLRMLSNDNLDRGNQGDFLAERVHVGGLDKIISLDMESTYVLGEVLEEFGLGLSFVPRRSRWGYGVWSKMFPSKQQLPSSPPFSGVAHYNWGHAEGEGIRFEPSELALSYDTSVQFLCNYMGAGLYSIRLLEDERVSAPMIARLGEPVTTDQGALYIDQLTAWPESEFVLQYQHRASLSRSWANKLDIKTKGGIGSSGRAFLYMTMHSDQPKLVTEVMENLVERYNQWRVKTARKQIVRSIGFLESELERLSRELEEVEEAYRRFLNANTNIVVNNTAAGVTSRWVDLERRIYDRNFQLGLLGYDISDSHPQAVRIRQELQELQEQKEEITKDFNILPAQEREKAKHLLDIGIAKGLYSRLHDKLLKSRLHLAGVSPPLSLLHTPTSTKNLSPLGAKVASLAATASVILLLAALYSFVTILFSSRILSFAEVEEAGAPVIGAIPHLPTPPKTGQGVDFFSKVVHSTERSSDVYAREASRAIYAKYHVAGRQSRPADQTRPLPKQGVAVVHTSATPGVGKSFTTLLMSCYLAKAGKKVLLIDADLRKRRVEPLLSPHKDSSWPHPSEHARGGGDKRPGLSEALQGKMTLKEVIQTNSKLQVDFITSGTVDETSPWLLTPEPLQALVEEAKAEYDVVFMDTPPLFAVAEAEAILTVADLSFIIIRHLTTTARDLRSCMAKYKSLGHMPTGAIFTDIALEQIGDIYDYGTYSYANYGGVDTYRYGSS